MAIPSILSGETERGACSLPRNRIDPESLARAWCSLDVCACLFFPFLPFPLSSPRRGQKPLKIDTREKMEFVEKVALCRRSRLCSFNWLQDVSLFLSFSPSPPATSGCSERNHHPPLARPTNPCRPNRTSVSSEPAGRIEFI